jgi:superfamily II DNA/RNA helicase
MLLPLTLVLNADLKGLSINGIKIVVQWCISKLDISTAWQRLGRAARAAQEHALVLLMAENKFSDAERENAAKAVAAKAVAAKAKTGGLGVAPQAKAKRTKNGASQDNAYLEKNMSDDYLRDKYNRCASDALLGRPTSVDYVDTVIDDIVNAGTRGIGCRRKPINLAFGNRDHRECIALH